MTAEELMTIANMGKGTDMSSYEHFMMAEKSARRPSGVGIAGLAIGSTALLAAVGAWIFAEEIVAAFQNQDGSKGPKWRDPDELFEKVEQHDGRVECEPYYNKWALYVAMNKAASDQNSVILKWIGDDKDKYIIACYDLALTDLKDKDRPYWIRKYFHVESKF